MDASVRDETKSPDAALKRSPSTGRSPSAPAPGPQLVPHFPKAEAEALATFEEIPDCVYQASKMGRTRAQDDPTCECSLEDGVEYACTEASGCINRLTQVECLADTCRCGQVCQNQRFQRHQYAPVEIVKTPMKGYGLRAANKIEADTFVYEYIGEVINHATFMRRMAQYKQEHVEHFYFMMLQREEYIDATRRGGRSRFINHSCNPNCYVSKWHVGKRVRMGIFAKRDIEKDEELTFNYNVDRYGSDPQTCYCGEPNCVGTIGGRTQTDVVTMDDLYINALGIREEVARIRATLPRGKRSKVLDEDFHPTLHAMDESEAARVITAVRQAASNRNILHKLLTRIQMTQNVVVHKALVKLHGFVIMTDVLHEWDVDAEMVGLILQCIAKWPLLARDKVVDSGADELVRHFAKDDVKWEDASPACGEVPRLAQSLLDAWDKLEVTFRIARRADAAALAGAGDTLGDADTSIGSWTERRRAEAEQAHRAAAQAPAEVSDDLRRSLRAYRESEAAPAPASGKKGHASSTTPPPSAAPAAPAAPAISIEEIIRRANEKQAQEQRAAQEAAERQAQASAKEAEEAAAREQQREARRKHRHSDTHRAEKRARHEEHERREARAAEDAAQLARLEKQLHKMVSAIAVRQLSKDKDQLERAKFHRHAKELTRVLAAKEMKNPKVWPPPRGPSGQRELGELSEEKRTKMKRFAHDYVKKVVAHEREKKSRAANGTGGADDSMAAGSPGSPGSAASGSPVNYSPQDVSQSIDMGGPT